MEKPQTFNADLAHLPAALAPLTLQQRWVVWRWELRTTKGGSSKWTKPPYQALFPKTPAKSNDPCTWGSYEDALAAVAAGDADGIGFMLLDSELGAGDLDHCRDPESGAIDQWAQAIVDQARLVGAYVEVTVSGTGLRVIGKSTGPTLHRRWKVNGRADAGLELYRNTARYLTVSGFEIGCCANLPDIDLIDDLAVQYDGDGQKGAGEEGAPNKADFFDFNDAASQNNCDDLDNIIVNGAPEGERSEAFQSVVGRLAAAGKSIDEIEEMLTRYPNGIAAKYQGRLRQEIERSFAKWKKRHKIEACRNGKPTDDDAQADTQSPPDEPWVWDSLDRRGVPKPTLVNTRRAIRALNIRCRYDEFHDKLLIDGRVLGEWAGEVSDYACAVLRDRIFAAFSFEPSKEHVHDAVVQLCLRDRFDPVVDYLATLQWDGLARLDTWLICYLGADDTLLNRAIGRLALVAAVRRARRPGCKFDQIIVLEGEEGTMKSSAIELLAGRENFSDQTILTGDDRQQQENLQGIWLYEVADLSGIRRAEVAHVKAFASRTHDRARPAYGRFRANQPRRCVMFATTNEDAYLKSQTGNRRFWPVLTRRIDIAALGRDRDQLWAEAARLEATGVSLRLDENLWSDARDEQDKRRERDPWDDLLAEVKGVIHSTGDGYEERVTSRELLIDVLGIKAERASDQQSKRLAYCMRRLGWQGPKKMRIDTSKNSVRGYAKSVPPAHSVPPEHEQKEPGDARDGRPWWSRQ